MQEDPSENPAWTTPEDLSGKDLFLIWKRITHSLVSSGRVAELHQELDSASRTGREVTGPFSQCRDPSLILNESLEAAANIAENNKLICYDDKEDGDTAMSSLSESEIDDDDDIRDVPSYLIGEAADLSPFRCKSPLQSFEDILAEEESLLSYDDINLSEKTSTATSYTHASTPASSPSPSHFLLDQGQRVEEGPNLSTSAEQSVGVHAKGQDPFIEVQETTPLQSTSTRPKAQHPVELGRPRLSDKKDLAPSEISVVAQRLIKKESICYFLKNCRLIYESFMPSPIRQSLSCSSSVEEHVIAAFDMVQHLVNGQQIHRLILRFAYVRLVQIIEVYKATATKDRVEGQVCREPGQRDITVAIDMYLAAKKISGGGLSRTKLLDYYRRGKRWSLLAGPSPISVFVFSHAADTIMYVFPLLLLYYLGKAYYLKGRTIPSRSRLFRRSHLRSSTIIPSLLVSWPKLASTQAWLPQAQRRTGLK